MTTVLIVYDSWNGHTKLAAEAMAKGVEAVDGAAAQLVLAEHANVAMVTAADALVMGSPVHQRTMSWQMKRFVDIVCEPIWFDDSMVGKVGGVFSTGGGNGGTGGGCEMCQIGMLANLAALGLVLVSFPKNAPGSDVAGMHWGPHIRTTDPETMMPVDPEKTDSEALLAMTSHGAHIAQVAARLKDLAWRSGARWPTAEVRAMRREMEAK